MLILGNKSSTEACIFRKNNDYFVFAVSLLGNKTSWGMLVLFVVYRTWSHSFLCLFTFATSNFLRIEHHWFPQEETLLLSTEECIRENLSWILKSRVLRKAVLCPYDVHFQYVTTLNLTHLPSVVCVENDLHFKTAKL